MSAARAGFVRRAGRARIGGDSQLVWSLAEGRRGRRWRATMRRGKELDSVLLLELATDGTPARLELATPAGMLTLHAEPDRRSILGNVVSVEGVRPLALSWSREHVLAVVGQPICDAAIVHPLSPRLAIGESVDLPTVSVDEGLVPTPGLCRVVRQAEDRWQVSSDGHAAIVTVNPEGVPEFAGDARNWPLEA